MRRTVWVVLILLCLFASSAQAATYYLSVSGANTNPGTSAAAPWRTLDKILLKRGDTFDGQVRLRAKGISGSPVTLGACGEGPAPLIRGDRPSLVWQAVAGFPGVYSAMLGDATSGPVSFRNNVVYSPFPPCRVVIPTGPVDMQANPLLLITP